MIKKIKFSPEGMTKDISKSKFPNTMYHDAKNIRLLATDGQSTFAVTNEYGNELSFSIPTPSIDPNNKRISYTGKDGILRSIDYQTKRAAYPRCELEEMYLNTDNSPKLSEEQNIIGKVETRNNVILFTTDKYGFDCIWELKNVSEDDNVYLELKYMRKMGFEYSKTIQAIYNYENALIEKIYWVDGTHQLRFINLNQSTENKDPDNLIDMDVSVIDTVGRFNTSQPTISSVTSGGSHTAGTIQYAYNLYRINGSQTTISPLSEMVDLGKVNKGGDLNEVVASMPTVSIKKIDKNYTHIKIYAIKYTSHNQAPEISIIADNEITNYDETLITDNGTKLSPISSAEFLFLGSNVTIPKHIETKNLRMFMFNVKEVKFDLDVDMRAYGHNSTGEAVVWSDVISDGLGGITTSDPASIIQLNTTTYSLDSKHDSINKDYSQYKFMKNGIMSGVEGKYCSIFFGNTYYQIDSDYVKTGRFFKSREIYRLGIEFYNKFGQVSFPKWISDVFIPDGNLEGLVQSMTFNLKPEFYSFIDTMSDDVKPIGYRILRSDRTDADKTIICQGFINSMIANIKHTSKVVDKSTLSTLTNNTNSLKMPSLQRPLTQNRLPLIGANDLHDTAYTYYDGNKFEHLGYGNNREGFKAGPSENWRAQNVQFNKMMQVFSPEVTFGSPVFNNSTILNVVGIKKESYQSNWAVEYNPVSEQNTQEAQFFDGLSPASPGVSWTSIIGDANNLFDRSIFGATNSKDETAVFQINREFRGMFLKTPSNGINYTNIYGIPELTEIGQGSTAYNGNSLYRYANSLKAMLIDNFSGSDSNKDSGVQIIGTNSYGAKCVTIMEGDDLQSTPISSRKSLEKIFTDAKFHELTGGAGQPGPTYKLGTGDNSAMVVELAHSRTHAYLGGMYGGNGIESKLRSSYIGIGEYSTIDKNVLHIKSPGDTYIHDFRIAKLTKTEMKLSGLDYLQATEFVTIPLETTINLKQRNDISINGWNNRFQPKESEYHNYNQVYSQLPTLIKNTGAGFKFKLVNEFDTKIIASSKKINGEFIDSWTNFLENETRTLDGRYGSINGVSKLADEIFTFQDTGIARLSIDPRVQVSASDGLAVQLGTGALLADHKYLTTNSGSKNKWSILSSGQGIYYYDAINRSIGKIGDGLDNLTEQLGFHSFMQNETYTSDLVIDDPSTRRGVVTGYNSNNGDVYFTFLINEEEFTLGYNELKKNFISFYDYFPSFFIFKGQRMITVGQDRTQGWQHFKGFRNNFYGSTYDSSITFLPNPGIDGKDVTYNNAEYRMEMHDNGGNEIPNSTFTGIRVFNEYQTTSLVELKLNQNVKRKFRDWNIIFPRAKDYSGLGRDRIRSPWAYVEFVLENPDGKKMTLHDVTVSYNEY